MRQSFAHRSRLLHAKVQGRVLLAPVQLPEVLLLLLVHDDVDARNGLPHDTDFGEFGSGTTGHLSNTQRGQLSLEVLKLLRQLFLFLRRSEHFTITILMLLVFWTRILESLEAAPP